MTMRTVKIYWITVTVNRLTVKIFFDTVTVNKLIVKIYWITVTVNKLILKIYLIRLTDLPLRYSGHGSGKQTCRLLRNTESR